METKLTPQQRLDCYKYAYDNIKEDLDFYTMSICWYLYEYLECNWFDFNIQDYNFFELLNKKPKNKTYGDYWWHPNDKQIRLDILQQCINEVSQLIENGGE